LSSPHPIGLTGFTQRYDPSVEMIVLRLIPRPIAPHLAQHHPPRHIRWIAANSLSGPGLVRSTLGSLM